MDGRSGGGGVVSAELLLVMVLVVLAGGGALGIAISACLLASPLSGIFFSYFFLNFQTLPPFYLFLCFSFLLAVLSRKKNRKMTIFLIKLTKLINFKIVINIFLVSNIYIIISLLYK